MIDIAAIYRIGAPVNLANLSVLPTIVIDTDIIFAIRGLGVLFARYGTTIEAVAGAVGVSPNLFTRIESGRQGLPEALVPKIAVAIGATDSEVRSNVSRIVATRSPRAYIPTPVRPDLGEPISYVLLHTIPPVPLHPAPLPH